MKWNIDSTKSTVKDPIELCPSPIPETLFSLWKLWHHRYSLIRRHRDRSLPPQTHPRGSIRAPHPLGSLKRHKRAACIHMRGVLGQLSKSIGLFGLAARAWQSRATVIPRRLTRVRRTEQLEGRSFGVSAWIFSNEMSPLWDFGLIVSRYELIAWRDAAFEQSEGGCAGKGKTDFSMIFRNTISVLDEARTNKQAFYCNLCMHV